MENNITQNIYENFTNSCIKKEQNEHYLTLFCLKTTKYGPKQNKNNYIKNSQILENRENLKYVCVLPKGHKGNCEINYNKIFKKTNITKKLIGSIQHKIYTTPGNDDYVYKNRASRLYSVVLSKNEEIKIRDKKIKKKCGIPLKEASTPILLAQAYIDWMTFIINIIDIDEYLNKNYIIFNLINKNLKKNKLYLKNIYYNRNIFNNDGNTICVITQNICLIENFSDPLRDNRLIISDNDIDFSHNIPKDNLYVSIYGGNLVPMCRKGNMILGNKEFTDNLWINELQSIIKSYTCLQIVL